MAKKFYNGFCFLEEILVSESRMRDGAGRAIF